MVDCPIECIDRSIICESPPDFLEKHSTFFITLVGIVGGGCGVLLTYFLKSRCTEISCFGIFCKRKPVEMTNTDVELTSSNNVELSIAN